MLSWLLGKPKNKKKPGPKKRTKAKVVPKQTTPPPQKPTTPPKRNSDEVAEAMGGAESIAQVIKTLLAEDKIRNSQDPPKRG